MSTENEKGSLATAPTANTGVPKDIPEVTKVIYTYSPDTMVFTGSDIIPSSQELLVGQTEVEPEQGLYQPITFDGTKWNGTDQAVWQAAQDAAYQEYLKEHPELAPHPSSEQQMINALGQQVASLTARLAQTNTTTSDGGAA